MESKNKNKITMPLVTYPRTIKIPPHASREEKKELRKKRRKPIENVLWKQIQKIENERSALYEARSILKKQRRKAQKKFRRKQLLNK